MNALEYWLISTTGSGILGVLLFVKRALGECPRWLRVFTVATAAPVALMVSLAFFRYDTDTAALMLLTSLAAIGLGARQHGTGRLF